MEVQSERIRVATSWDPNTSRSGLARAGATTSHVYCIFTQASMHCGPALSNANPRAAAAAWLPSPAPTSPAHCPIAPRAEPTGGCRCRPGVPPPCRRPPGWRPWSAAGPPAALGGGAHDALLSLCGSNSSNTGRTPTQIASPGCRRRPGPAAQARSQAACADQPAALCAPPSSFAFPSLWWVIPPSGGLAARSAHCQPLEPPNAESLHRHQLSS